MEVVKTTFMKMSTQRTSYMRLRGGVERHVLSFPRFPVALLDCGTRHLYASCFVVQLLGDLYENETYKGVCGRSSLSNVVLYENVNEILYWVWFGPYMYMYTQTYLNLTEIGGPTQFTWMKYLHPSNPNQTHLRQARVYFS